MLERILNSKSFLSFVLAAGTWIVLFFRYPFPAENLYLQLISMKDPLVYSGMHWTYVVMMFTTPYFLYSFLFSGIYIFAYRHGKAPRAIPLPLYADPATRSHLHLILGEIHHPTKFIPSDNPRWLSFGERALFTGVIFIGSVGTGKTSGGMRPAAEQLIAFKHRDEKRRVGGLVLEVKGDFCRQVQEVMSKYTRDQDYIEISLDADFRYNPLYNDLDAYSLAYGIASLLSNLFGRGKEPFWQQAYTNLVKFIILLHKLVYQYVTLFDVYECSISPSLLQKKISDGEKLFATEEFIFLSRESYAEARNQDPTISGFNPDEKLAGFLAPRTRDLEEQLNALHRLPQFSIHRTSGPLQDSDKREQFESVKRWFYNDWQKIDNKLRTSIVEGISVFLSLFDDNPQVKRVFCPPKETYDPSLNTVDQDGRYKYGRPLPSFDWLIEEGKVCALNFPMSSNAGLARALGTMMKMDFQRAVLQRIPTMANQPAKYFRPVFFLCDEYQAFATVGEDNPNGDEKFFSLSRQAKCIAIVATQSISSLRSTLPGESYRTLLQTFRTKVFLALSDEFSSKTASELCGQEDKPLISYSISESGQNTGVSLLTGKTTSEKDSVSATKNYSLRRDFRFPQKVFAELANAQAVVIPYDGFEAKEATLCYLKPYYLDPNVSYFEQVNRGWL